MSSSRWLGVGVVAWLGACGPTFGAPDGRPERDAEEEPDAARSTRVLAHTATELFRVDDSSFVAKSVSPFQWPAGVDTDQMTDLAVDSSGRVIGISFDRVYEIDPGSAVATELADLAVSFNGLAFLPTAGGDALYGSTTGGELYKVNPDTGVANLVGRMSGGYKSSGDLVHVPGRGLLATVIVGSSTTAIDELAVIDPATAVVTPIGSTGIQDLWGIGYWSGAIYAFAPDGTRARIDLDTGVGTILGQETEHAWWGAGTSP